MRWWSTPDDADAIGNLHEKDGVARVGKAEIAGSDVIDRPADAGELGKPLETLLKRPKIGVGFRFAELPVRIDRNSF